MNSSNSSKWLSQLKDRVPKLGQEEALEWQEARARLLENPDLWALALWLVRQKASLRSPVDPRQSNSADQALFKEGQCQMLDSVCLFLDSDKKLTV